MGIRAKSDMIKVTLDELLQAVSAFEGEIDRVYWHWTAGRYGQFWSDYPINIDEDGSIYISDVEDINGDGLVTIADIDGEDIEATEATWRRNSRSTAIGCLCMMGATTKNFGAMPLTHAQIESSARVMAILSLALNLPLTYDCFRTHCEQALEDGYGPYSGDPQVRWDGWMLEEGDDEGTGGDILRGKANYYWNEFQEKMMKGESIQ